MVLQYTPITYTHPVYCDMPLGYRLYRFSALTSWHWIRSLPNIVRRSFTELRLSVSTHSSVIFQQSLKAMYFAISNQYCNSRHRSVIQLLMEYRSSTNQQNVRPFSIIYRACHRVEVEQWPQRKVCSELNTSCCACHIIAKSGYV
jgi:hypothetical protein